MLSKKQALLFFLGGTLLFSIIFIVMSFDTVARGIPEQTHEENMTAEVIHGRTLWDENNCMGCHTLMGEGAYYAPELTKVYDRMGPDAMKVILMSKQPWAPNGRQMVAYGFSQEDAEGIIAFLKWVGEIDLNGYPADPPLKNKLK